jgi:hypothetical protein
MAQLEMCDVRNLPNCLLLTPVGHMSTFYDEDGNELLCCEECEMPMTEAEEAEARAKWGDEVWDSLA